jgi:hypothetical protein
LFTDHTRETIMQNRIACAALALVAGMAAAQDVTFQLRQVEDIGLLSDHINTPNFFIGSNPMGIAYDGNALYVVGFDNGGASSGSTSYVVQIGNFLAGPGGRTFATAPGSATVIPLFRGRMGLSWDADFGLLSTIDRGNNSDPGQIAVYPPNGSGGLLAPVLSTNGRGIAGPSWDNGPTGAGFSTSLGNGAAAAFVAAADDPLGPIGLDPGLLDPFSVIYFSGSGGYPLTIGGSTTDTQWRDLDINPDGGVAARSNGSLYIVERNASNGQASQAKVTVPDPNVVGSNVHWVHDVACADGDIVLWNQRQDPGSGGTFLQAVKATKRDGSAANVAWLDAAGAPFDAVGGSRIWEFEWDAANQLLFVLSFDSRQVYVFEPVCEDDCPADLTGDGQVDSGDLATFITAFLAQDANVADLTNDGQVDSGDLALFIQLFIAGC